MALKLIELFSQDLELLKTIRIPILMYSSMKNKKDKETGKKIKYKSETMCSINNWATIHWSAKSELKNKYKSLLSEWFISSDKIPEDCFFVWQPVYTDKRKRDSLNQASVAKIIEDTFVQEGALEDDDKTNHILLSGKINTQAKEHMLEVRIFGECLNKIK
jgi:hypothetical protein